MTGTLYIVATPIGNLGDITRRAEETLHAVDLIACEDTRVTRKLLGHLHIKKPLISVRESNERKASELIVGKLAGGSSVAYCSDAGTPAVSDPGARLVEAAAAAGARVVPIPGPSALATALSLSGFASEGHYFGGFLPSKAARRVDALDAVRALPCPLVFYESPHRAADAIRDARNVLGDRRVVVLREMTKLHEEIHRTTLEQAAARTSWRGEITLVIEGAPASDGDPCTDKDVENWIVERVGAFPSESTKDTAVRCAATLGISRARAYQCVLNARRNSRG